MKRIFLILSSCVVCLLFVELSLAMLGFKPGIFLNGKQIKGLDFIADQSELKEYEFFTADSLGLLKVNQKYLEREIPDLPPLFQKFVTNLKRCSYNSDGFRGNEFVHLQDKTNVLFIGNSYTFGFDAEPYDSAYIDLVGEWSKDLNVLNAGIPAADLAVYAQVASVYVPRIRPEIVVVGIKIDSEVIFHKTLHPYENPDLFFTNKGVLMKTNFTYSPDSVEVYNNAEAAYRSIIKKYTAIYIKQKWLKVALEHSRLLTVVYSRLYKPSTAEGNNSRRFQKEEYSREYVRQIKEVCAKHNSKLIFTIIPMSQGNFEEKYERDRIISIIGDDSNLYYPEGINKGEHYRKSTSGHFNNEGHKFYAHFILNVLSKYRKMN